MKEFPKARQNKLIVREFANEVLIYDKERQQAHCLNQTAALVWKHCDGRTPVAEISRRLATEIGDGEAAVDDRLVWYALSQFKRDHLLEEIEVPAGMLSGTGGGLSRRKAIKALGLATIVAVPLVTSMIAPTAAQAATCFPAGHACTSGTQCCSGVCNASVCA